MQPAAPHREGLSPDRLALLQRRVAGAAAKAAAGPAAREGKIPHRTGSGQARLSFAQRRLWFLDQLEPNNTFYNIACALRWQGVTVHIAALRRAIAAVVARHEALRTTFVAVDGEPQQLISPEVRFDFDVTDLRELDATTRPDEALRRAREQARVPFDLARGPLLRVGLLRLADDDVLFLLCMHHIVSDGWSMGVFMREFNAAYAAALTGQPAALPPLQLQYADFAEWQQTWLAGARLDAQIAYWRQRLRDLPVLRLPTDRPRPKAKAYRGAQQALTLPAATCARLRALAETLQATPFMVLAATFAALLARYSGDDDIVVGAPIANRNHADIEPLIGYFVNSVVLRIQTGGGAGLRELVGRTRQVALEAYQNQDVPFERLVEALHPERDPSRNPLFQVTLQLLNTPSAGIGASTVTIDRGTAIFDIACTLVEQDGALGGGFEYDTELFDAATMQRMARHFGLLLDAALDAPDAPLAGLPLLTDEERATLATWSCHTAAFPEHELLHQLVQAQARATPDAPAVRDAAGHEIDYRELEARANRLARHLAARGFDRRRPVAVALERGIDLVVTLLAVLKHGSAYLPLERGDPDARIAAMLDDAGAAAVVTNEAERGRFAAWPCVLLDAEGAAIGAHPAEAPAVAVDPECAAYVIFTSGSTGRPNAVCVPHRALCNHMRWMQQAFPIAAGHRVLQRTPVGFDASVWEFWAPLVAGATLVMHEPEAHFDGATLVRAIRRHRIGSVQLVPSLLRLLLQEPELAAASSLERVFCGGEPLTPDLVERFQSRLDASLVNLYGPTETCIDATCWVVPRGWHDDPVPIGRPIANVSVAIESGGVPVPQGAAGELVIGGRGVALGYAGGRDPARRFEPDPAQPGRLRYRTGDRVRWRADGVLEYLGRIDHQIKSHGVRIEPGEIEALLRRHPEVDQALVMLRRADPAAPEQLVAHVTLRADAAAQAGDRQVAAWNHVYDEVVYRELDAAPDAPDFTGWTRSDTGAPIPREEMQDWLDATLARLRAGRGSTGRVLEIGCGTGLIALSLAPACRHYCGVDFSERAVAALAARSSRRGLAPCMRLLARRAEAIADLADGSYDLVILNSVVQYFPSVDYLLGVLELAVRAARPGGRIFVGDVRLLSLLAPLHATLERAAAPGDSAGAVLERTRRRSAHEEELALGEAFFATLPARLPRVRWVQLQPKRGLHANELSCFRFDAMLHLDTPPAPEPAETLHWDDGAQACNALAERLRGRPAPFVLRGIANPRTQPALQLLRALERAHPDEPVARLTVDAPPPDLLHSIEAQAEAAAWHCEFHAGSTPGLVDAVLAPRAHPVPPGLACAAEAGANLPLSNQPWRAAATSRVAGELRDLLRSHLPQRMVPGQVLVLERFALSANGKIDRRALAAAAQDALPVRQAAFVAPAEGAENELARLWQALLGVPRVGAQDSFFDLGGHSLLAAQLASRIREHFRIELPLRTVFESPRLADMAAALAAAGARCTDDATDIDALAAELAHWPADAVGALLAR